MEQNWLRLIGELAGGRERFRQRLRQGRRLGAGPRWWLEMESLLQTLPLDAEEYGLSRCRLRNARQYSESDRPELGAAAYELYLAGAVLQRALTRWLRYSPVRQV